MSAKRATKKYAAPPPARQTTIDDAVAAADAAEAAARGGSAPSSPTAPAPAPQPEARARSKTAPVLRVPPEVAAIAAPPMKRAPVPAEISLRMSVQHVANVTNGGDPFTVAKGIALGFEHAGVASIPCPSGTQTGGLLDITVTEVL